MKKFFLLLFAAAVMCACKTSPKANFGYNVTPPLTVEFVNLSNNADSYRWDFGDGTHSFEKEPVHTYSSTGSYRVTLRAKGDKADDVYSGFINIPDPYMYVAGVIYAAIPYESQYYRTYCKRDGGLFESEEQERLFSTYYSESLYSSTLPYPYKFETPVQIRNFNDDYIVSVYTSKTTNQNGTKVLDKRISRQELLSYPDFILLDDNNMSVAVVFVYQ